MKQRSWPGPARGASWTSQGLEDDEAAGDPSGWHYYAVEKAVEDSGVAWTHLRPGEFMTNTLGWAEEIRTTGAVRSAYPDSANAPIDLDDIADARRACCSRLVTSARSTC